jgi:DNA-binding transcriptional LysR family regulator
MVQSRPHGDDQTLTSFERDAAVGESRSPSGMVDLNDFLFFVKIVDCGGFTAASRALGVPKSTLSQRMSKLEAHLEVRLLTRSSRHVRMSEAGSEFYRHAVAVLREADMAQSAVRQRLVEPSGTVRCTAGAAAMQFGLAEIIASFLAKHPKVSVLAHATDRFVDIIKEDFDIALRGHSDPLPDSGLVQRTLATTHIMLFAGANYLAEHGEPAEPADLSAHSAVAMMRESSPGTWRLQHALKQKEDAVVTLSARLVSEDVWTLQKAAIQGIGIVALPPFVCREAVISGSLKRVLPDWSLGPAMMTAVLPHRQGMLPAIRAFLDHLSEEVPKVMSG